MTHVKDCRCWDCLTSEAKTKCTTKRWCLRGNGHVGACAGAVDMARAFAVALRGDARRVLASLTKGEANGG